MHILFLDVSVCMLCFSPSFNFLCIRGNFSICTPSQDFYSSASLIMISLQSIKKPIIPLPILYCCSLLFVPLCPSFFLCLDLFILFCHFPPQFLRCSFSLWIHVFILLRHTFQKLPNKGYLVNKLFESLYVNMSLSSYPTGCLDIEIPVGFSHCSHLCKPRA